MKTRKERKAHNEGFEEGYGLGRTHGKEYITKDETRINALAEIYKRSTHDAAIVADICDNVIDRTGGFLGELRKVVRNEKETS